MDESYARFAARAAGQHHVLSLEQFDELGISRKVRGRWLRLGLIEQVGVHTYGVAGTRSWQQSLRAMAVRAFEALSCEGLARVDFFVRPDKGPALVGALLAACHVLSSGQVLATCSAVA